MRKLSVFNNVSLDGYFVDADGGMSWAHDDGGDPEFAAFTASNASGAGILIFGRITYQMMAGFWPTDEAKALMPEVAAGMNRREKIVFSGRLGAPGWENVRVIKDQPAAAVRSLKEQEGPDLTVLGSGTIVSQLAAAGLVDEYQLIICPVVLAAGRTMFEGLGRRINLARTSVRAFRNGKIHACYVPARAASPTD